MSPAPFHEWLGIEVETRGEGRTVYHLAIQPAHRNGAGAVHGGVIAALLDSAMGSAVVTAIPKEWWCSTTSLSVQFLEGTRPARLTARGTVMRRGARVAHVAGELVDGDGKLIATAEGSWHLRPHRPGAEPPPSRYVVVRGTGERIGVGKIVAVGRNYAEHIREMGGSGEEPPVLFLKPATALAPASAQWATLSLANVGATVNAREVLFPMVSQGNGAATGGEVLFERTPGGRWYGQANLSISKAKHAGTDARLRPGSYDYPVILNMDGGAYVTDKWLLTGRLAWLSGRPYTPYDEAASRQAGYGLYDLARVNAERAPDYFRLDLRVERPFRVAQTELLIYGGVQNITNRRNFAGCGGGRGEEASTVAAAPAAAATRCCDRRRKAVRGFSPHPVLCEPRAPDR